MEPMVTAVAAAWFGLFATTDANSSSSWVGGAAALTLLTIAIAFNFRNQLQNSRERRTQEAMCRWQISVLVEVLDVNGIPMPAKFWDEPPKQARQMQEDEMKQRKRRTFGMIDEEDGASILLGAASLCVVIFVSTILMLNIFIIKPLQELQETNQTRTCYAALNADYYVAVADAFLSPSSPSPERDVAVKKLKITAEKIRHRVTECDDNDPKN
jgi:hypothetical protein